MKSYKCVGIALAIAMVAATVAPSLVVAAPPECNGNTATIYVDSGFVVGGPNNGVAYVAGTTVLQGTAGDDVIVGTSDGDIINGGGGNDTVCAGDGDNTITCLGGDDWINAGDGNNTIAAGDGKNTVMAGDGNNTITGGTGKDDIHVGDGNNVIDSGDGSDTIVAGDGNNSVTTDGGADSITTGSGNDIIDSGDGNDTVNAGDGNNTVTTEGGVDNITTGSGDDVIDSGNGNDIVNAGDGDNSVTTDGGADNVTTGSGNDIIDTGVGDDTVDAGDGNNIVTTANGDDNITTGSGDDFINAGGNDNTVNSGGGNDVIYAGDGNDTVDGGPGFDCARLGGGINTPSNIECDDSCPNSVHVVLDGLPGSPQTFSFTGDLGAFTLDDDSADLTYDYQESQALSPGTYGVTEIVPAGWDLTSIVVTGDLDNGSVIGIDNVSIDLDEGECIICTFADDPEPAYIRVNKQTEPEGGAGFNFDGDLGTFSLDDDGTMLFGPFLPGDYDVYEVVPLPSGWLLTSVDVTALGGSTDSPITDGVTIGLVAGDEVTVTFTNTEEVQPAPVRLRSSFTVGGEVAPVNKVGIVAPWICLALLGLGGWFAVRSRSARS